MSKRTGLRHALALLLLFAGRQAFAQVTVPGPNFSTSPEGVTFLQGVVSSFSSKLSLAVVDGVPVYLGAVISGTDVTVSVGDEVVVLGGLVESAGLISALSVQILPSRAPKNDSNVTRQSITGTGASVQSITGTGKQSITGTGVSVQSITGTGKQSITGTGVSVQSITGTGASVQSITGTGISTQSITGTGSSASSKPGTELEL